LKKKTSEMERFVEETIAKGQPWTDPDFRPDESSLYDPNVDSIDEASWQRFTWKRGGEIYSPAFIFEDGIEPNDIN